MKPELRDSILQDIEKLRQDQDIIDIADDYTALY